MISRSMTNRMRAAAIAAVMCISSSAAVIPSMIQTSVISASAAVVTEMAVGDTYKAQTADLAESGIKTINFTLVPDYTGGFTYGFGISTAASPWWYELDAEKGFIDTKDGTIDAAGTAVTVEKGVPFTVTIDVSKLDVKYADAYDSKNDGHIEFRNYYSGEDGGKVTITSVTVNDEQPATVTTEPTTEPATEDSTEDSSAPAETTEPTEDTTQAPAVSGDKLAKGDVYKGFTADLAASGIKNITITLTPDYTGGFTYGFGIGTADSPYWYEWDGKTWVDTKDGTIEVPGTELNAVAGEDIVVVIDTSKLSLSYNPSSDKYPGKFEFRNYYSGEENGSVTIKSVVANGTAEATPVKDPDEEPTTEDQHSLSIKDGKTTKNSKSGSWSFTDNQDGTGTMTATQARQIEFETPLTLTRGYDEEYYAKEGVSPVEGTDPLNSHKFHYSDFGLSGIGQTGNITVESLMATIQSKQNVKNFMYGGGLNVENQSPADTESAKAKVGVATTENAGYWYNDMGQEKIEEYQEAGVEFGIEPGYGYYLSSEDNQLGTYFSVIWDVPEAVKPYEDKGDISFQYWYGVEDAEEYTEIDAVDLVGGILTYTETQKFDYTASKKTDVGKTIKAGDMSGELSFIDDLGLTSADDVKAVVFTVSASQDLDKLVYGVGASVGDDWKQWAEEGAAWNYVVTDTTSSEDIEIAWIVPSGADINEEYGNLQFGYWYGGQGETELSSVTLKSVEVFYKTEETALTANLYGDVDESGKVDVMDVILLNKALFGKADMTPQGMANADVDLDGKPTFTDSLNIMRLIVKLLSQDDFPLSK